MSVFLQQKGKAIEVAESLGERQPSMVLRRLRSYDADVVIEVCLEFHLVLVASLTNPY